MYCCILVCTLLLIPWALQQEVSGHNVVDCVNSHYIRAWNADQGQNSFMHLYVEAIIYYHLRASVYDSKTICTYTQVIWASDNYAPNNE